MDNWYKDAVRCDHWKTYFAWVEHLGRLKGVIKCSGCTIIVREP